MINKYIALAAGLNKYIESKEKFHRFYRTISNFTQNILINR